MKETPYGLQDWLAGRAARQARAERFEKEFPARDLTRSRPRNRDEWTWLKSRGVSPARLGPMWHEAGPVPRRPPGDDRD